MSGCVLLLVPLHCIGVQLHYKKKMGEGRVPTTPYAHVYALIAADDSVLPEPRLGPVRRGYFRFRWH
jgi:hypothetical protein